MSDASERFALPYLQPGQAQKELFHNEALTAIDMLLHPVVEGVDTVTPPTAPAVGQGWAVGSSPSGAWSGHGHQLAVWTEGGWRFAAPVTGMSLWSAAAGLPVRWTGTGWLTGELAGARVRIGGVQVIGNQAPAIVDPTGGTTVDGPARATITTILQALRQHGLIAA